MNIVIIGTGNAATVLGKKLKIAGHQILQVAGRNSAAASKLAYELGTMSTNYLSSVNLQAELYIIAVSDSAIPAVIENLRLPGKIVVHTAAAVDIEILKTVSEHYGVLYPLQTLNSEMARLPDTPMFIDASDEPTRIFLESVAHSIGGEHVIKAGNEDRLRLHLAAVLACNFPNYLYILAEEYCRHEGIDFKLLQPLIGETALRIAGHSPRDLQTGPAIRHDSATIRRHLDLLKSYPGIHKVYAFLSERIEELR